MIASPPSGVHSKVSSSRFRDTAIVTHTHTHRRARARAHTLSLCCFFSPDIRAHSRKQSPPFLVRPPPVALMLFELCFRHKALPSWLSRFVLAVPPVVLYNFFIGRALSSPSERGGRRAGKFTRQYLTRSRSGSLRFLQRGPQVARRSRPEIFDSVATPGRNRILAVRRLIKRELNRMCRAGSNDACSMHRIRPFSAMFTVALSVALSFARAFPFGEYDDSAFAPRTAAAKRHPRILSCATRAVLPAALAPSLFALPVASSGEQPARFSSRHDDECRNVRPEARNSMDRARVRDSCAAYSVLGNRPKARVYEISSLSLSLCLSCARRNVGFIRAPFRAIFFP